MAEKPPSGVSQPLSPVSPVSPFSPDQVARPENEVGGPSTTLNKLQTSQVTQERPKVALQSHLGYQLLRLAVHILPILATSAVVALSLASVYWSDLSNPHINSQLKAFQFAAKAHELLINASLMAVVVDEISSGLNSKHGVPLGFVMSAYHLSSLSYLMSWEFWGAISSTSRIYMLQRMPLGLLIGYAFSFAAIAGPLSAIALIPQLDWWLVEFEGRYEFAYFMNVSVGRLSPNLITSAVLDSSCTRNNSVNNTLCPTAGWQTISNWASVYVTQHQSPNLSITDDVGAIRYVTSESAEEMPGWSVTSSITANQASNLRSFWEFADANLDGLTSVERPLIIPGLSNGESFKKPLVEVICVVSAFETLNSSTRVLPSNLSETYPNQRQWQIVPKSIDLRSPQFPSFDFIDLSTIDGAPSIGAALTFTDGSGARQEALCTVAAQWIPVDLWIDPTTDATVGQNSPNPRSLTSSPPQPGAKKISMGPEWADSLNPTFGRQIDFGPFKNDTISVIERLFMSLGSLNGSHSEAAWILNTTQLGGNMAELVSTVLGLHITDGLARILSKLPVWIYVSPKNNLNTTIGHGSIVPASTSIYVSSFIISSVFVTPATVYLPASSTDVISTTITSTVVGAIARGLPASAVPSVDLYHNYLERG